LITSPATGDRLSRAGSLKRAFMSDKKLTLEERLYANEYRTAKESHLEISDEKKCLTCEGRPCTTICPAGTYTWSDESSRILVSFENCLECGGCRAVCPSRIISWRYPMGGAGICYRYG